MNSTTLGSVPGSENSASVEKKGLREYYIFSSFSWRNNRLINRFGGLQQ
jgi:hypothetical protein